MARGRKPTGRRPVHHINISFDMDVHQWMQDNIPANKKTKFINDLIRKRAGIC